MERSDLIKAIKTLEQQLKRQEARDFTPYNWQKTFHAAGKTHRERMVCAANQVGKTLGAALEIRYHLTGNYPPDWEGHVFDHAPQGWGLGYSGEQIRDVIQSTLFGELNADTRRFDGGLILPHEIEHPPIRSALPGLAKDVKVKHSSGGLSCISFKSYSQGQHALMGKANLDFAWIDEEPRDEEVPPQVLTRTAAGGNKLPDGVGYEGGLVLYTMTPENGVTQLVKSFMEEKAAHKFFLNVTWDDAPHLSEAKKAELLDSYPEWQKEMRSRGVPILGTGRIYPFRESSIQVPAFEIPPHWARIAGIDFGGGDHPLAVAWLAWDRDSDVLYVYDVYREKQVITSEVALMLSRKTPWVPVAWPHDGCAAERSNLTPVADQYRELGANMLPDRATFEDGSNGVAAGIYEVSDRIKTSRFKVFSHLEPWFEEFRIYHRKRGKIVKVRDDLMDATRYAVMMLRFADTQPTYDDYDDDDAGYGSHNAMGY